MAASPTRDRAMTDREMDKALKHYEGLIFKTATMVLPSVQGLELDDIRQLLRIKVWKAFLSYDPKRSKMSQDRFVFSCMRNRVKDILKAKYPNDLFIEDFSPKGRFGDQSKGEPVASYASQAPEASDWFEARYLVEDQTYRSVEESDATPLPMPADLTELELRFVLLLYADRGRMEIRRELGLSAKAYHSVNEGVCAKFEGWGSG